MADDDRVTKLEAQIDKLEVRQAELYEQLAEARLDQWKARLEDLEVQMHLGAMDTNDRLTALVQRARDRWDDAKFRLTEATSTAGDVIESVRTGIDSALNDLRQALIDARSQVKQAGKTSS
jgi:hypothetical protein